MVSAKILTVLLILEVSSKCFSAKLSIPMDEIKQAVHEAEMEANFPDFKRTFKHPKLRKTSSPACAMAQKVTQASETTKKINKIGTVMESATDRLLDKYRNYPKSEVLHLLQQVSLPKESRDNDPQIACNRIYEVQCDITYPYRSATGYCNNLDKPYLGAAYSEFPRILPSAYADGLKEPRSESKNGGNLPSPREISLAVHQTESKLDTDHTHMLMIWGQFTDHDITLTPTAPISAEPGMTLPPSVCKPCNSHQQHSDCLPIPLKCSDPTFGGIHECMAFVRSARGNTNLGTPRQQLNQITSYIDASNVYGSETFLLIRNDAFLNLEYLRSFANGELIVTDQKLMPPARFQVGCQSRNAQPNKCFLAGDVRNSEQMSLTSMQTLWVREHNYIAENLASMNKQWSDDTIFLETRRIIGALHQHITYNEFLPAVIGPQLMHTFNIREERGGQYFTKYNRSCDATIFTEFATAAFRFGHSLVDGYLKVQGPNSVQNYSLFTNFFNPDFLYDPNNGINPVLGLLIGATEQQNLAPDRLITSVLRDHLFQNNAAVRDGFDLAALNIQRGRDHGIPSYTAYREHFTKEKVTSFDYLKDKGIMNAETVSKLKSVYDHVDDIDLWTGIVSELPVQDGVVGLVGASIIGAQFHQLKHCDRFFYSNGYGGDIPTHFSPDQLKEIRKISLSHILCRQAGSSYPDLSIRQHSMKKLACEPPRNLLNCKIPCKNYKGIDLMKWKATSSNKYSSNFQSKYIPDGRCIAEQYGALDFGVSF